MVRQQKDLVNLAPCHSMQASEALKQAKLAPIAPWAFVISS